MSDEPQPTRDERITQLLDMVLELARGRLTARVMPSALGDDVDSLATGLNMLAEELEASIESERAMRAELESRVAERTRELEERLATIAAQAATIRELSTPVLKVWKGVLVMPLVGVLDTRRAQQMTEQLLEAIGREQARVAIVDITGVSVMDTAVADHLMETVRAARMLGAQAILTGIGPVNAQTLVKLRVELGELPTAGTLESALKKALAITGNGAQPPRPSKR